MTTQQITHSYIKENYTCENYHNDDRFYYSFGKKLITKWKVNKYEIDPRTILPNGKPIAQLLLRENCTVTITHSKTKNLKEECLKADILIAAVGKANLVKKDWVKNDSIIIDVGINKLGDKIVGDVSFEEVKDKVKAITPVPGGVGPMTIACLLKNTLECFKARLT